MIFWKKTISILLVQAFLLSSLPIETLQSASAVSADTAAIKEITTNPDSVVISRDHGLVKSKFTGKNGKLIVHIQDAHCNYEAQSNIAKIIESLVKNSALSFVSVEGADGLIDTSWFKAFPDVEIRKEVANYFMKKGEITGPEFLSITTDYPIKLYGAETREYYIQNLNAFTSSYPLKGVTEKYLNQIKTVLNKLKKIIYNSDLKAMDSKASDYEAKTMQFNEYVRFLQAEAEKYKINLRQYDNFFKLVNVLIYEKKIDFNVTDKERSALIDELSKAVSKDVLTELVNQSIAFKVGKISSADYYHYVKALAFKNEIELSAKFPNLYNYMIYNSVYSRIENEKLFSDIKALETAIKEKLFENDDQRSLEKLSRHIDTLLGLVNIKLLNGDFEYYKTHKEEFAPEAFEGFIKDKSIQFGLAYEMEPPADTVANSLAQLEDFYAIAIKRDKALVDNTLKGMSEAGQKLAVLVTGGFHSEGMAKLLEEQGISYVVVCPNITKDVPTPYIQVLTNQRTSFEDILVGAQEPAKQNMLAPFSIAEAIAENTPLNKETIPRLYDRAINVKERWISFHLRLWVKAAFNYVKDHRIGRDRKVIRDAYEIAVENALSSLVGMDQIDKIQAAAIKADILGSPEFDATFNRVYDNAISGAGMASVMPNNVVGIIPNVTAPTPLIDPGRGAFRIYGEGLTPKEHAEYNKVIGSLLDRDFLYNNSAYSLVRNNIVSPGTIVLPVKSNLPRLEKTMLELLKKNMLEQPEYSMERPEDLEVTINIIPGMTSKLEKARIPGVIAGYHTQSRTVDIDENVYTYLLSLSRYDCASIAKSDNISSGARIISKIVIHEIVHIYNPILPSENLKEYESRIDNIITSKNKDNVITEEEKAVINCCYSTSDAKKFDSKKSFEDNIPPAISTMIAGARRFNQPIDKERVGKENAYPHPLIPGRMFYLDDFAESAVNPQEYINHAEEMFINGEIVNQPLFAGAATRARQILGGSAKYFFNGRDLMKADIAALRYKVEDLGLTVAQHNLIDRLITKYRYDADEIQKSAKVKNALLRSGLMANKIEGILDTFILYRVTKDMQAHPELNEIDDIELGPRLMIQYRLELEKLAAIYASKHLPEARQIEEDAVKKAKFCIHVNDQTVDNIVASFRKWNFFGFNRENIVFIVQDTFEGLRLDGNKLVRVPGKRRPFGHGYTLMQTVRPGGGFIIDNNGDPHVIVEKPLEYLQKNGAVLMANTNVDDWTKLIPVKYDSESKAWNQLESGSAAIDISRMAQTLYFMKNYGAKVVVETVKNLKGQKGGSWLRDIVASRELLVEGLALQDHIAVIDITTKQPLLMREETLNKKLYRKMNKKEQKKFWTDDVFMNKMANVYDIEALLKYLPAHGLPNYLKEDGSFSLESVTGDVTHIPEMNAMAFSKEGEEILSFKKIGDTEGTLRCMLAQDRDLKFKDLVAQIRPKAPGVQKASPIQLTPEERNRLIKERAYDLWEKTKNPANINWENAEKEINRKYPPGVGAIRGRGGEVSEKEHGTRTHENADYNRAVVAEEKSLNGIIARKIDADNGGNIVYALSNGGRVVSDEKPFAMVAINDFSNDEQAKIESVKKMLSGEGITFAVIKGLKGELITAKIAPDLLFHPGITRRAVYIDEDDFMYLLSLPNGVGLIMEAVNHELAHINNPELSEDMIEKQAPTKNVRLALAAGEIEEGMDQKIGSSSLRDALDNPGQSYEIFIPDLIGLYGSNIKWAIDRMQKSTAGIRGILDKEDILGGPQLNAAVIAFMAQGYADYINANFPEEQRGAFIGFDPRYFSREFAEIFTRVLLANGVKVYRDINEQYSQTPVASYMAYHLKIACGIEITSSHNPPNQNGIKSMTWYGGVDTDDVSAKIAMSIQRMYDEGIAGRGVLKIGPYDAAKIQTIDAKKWYYDNYMSRLFDEKNTAIMKAAMDKGARFVFDGLYGVGGPSMEYYLDRMFAGYDWRGKIIIMNATPDSSIGGIERPDPSNPKTLEVSGVLETLASTPGVLIAVTADMDADRIGTAVIIPEKDVERAKRYGLFVSQMKFAGNVVNIVRFTPNQIFTLISYERVLQAYERKLGTRQFDAIKRAIAEGTAPELYLLTSIPSSLIAKQMIEAFGGKAILTAVGFKNLGYEAQKIDREHPDAIIVSLMEESGGANIGPFTKDSPQGGASIHRDKDTIVLALALFSSASKLNLENKNMLDLYADMAANLGGLFYYERIDAYLPSQALAESLDSADQKNSDAIKRAFIGRYRAIDNVREPGATQSNLDKSENIVTLARLFGKRAEDIIGVEELPVANTVLLVGEGSNWQHVQPTAKRFTFRDNEVIEVFHTGREDQEGPSIAIYDSTGKLKARSLLRASGTESLIRVYLEIFEPQNNPHPENLYQYFIPLLQYLGLQNYSLKEGGNNYVEDHIEAVNAKYLAEGQDGAVTVTEPTEVSSEEVVGQIRKWLEGMGMRETVRNEYEGIIATYRIDIDVSELKKTTGTIAMLKVPGGMLEDVTVILAQDMTDVSSGTRMAIQSGAKFINSHLGDSVKCVRGEGDGLIGAVNEEIKKLGQGRRYAVVASGKYMPKDTREKLLKIIQDTNNEMQKGRSGDPLSALLEITGEEDMSIAALQSLSLKIGFNLPEEKILDFLNSIARTADSKPFVHEDLRRLLQKGFLALRPLRPININDVDKAHRAENAVRQAL